MSVSTTLEEKFWSKIEMIPFHECWEWVGRTKETGYGYTEHQRNKVKTKWLAHRLSLVINGTPLINWLTVDHICRNRACVNPRHLRQISHSLNAADNANARKINCAKGHTLDRIYFEKDGRIHRKCSICIKQSHQNQKRRLAVNNN